MRSPFFDAVAVMDGGVHFLHGKRGPDERMLVARDVKAKNNVSLQDARNQQQSKVAQIAWS